MKVLWFTTSSSIHKSDICNPYNGESWVSSLEHVISTKPDIELAIAFFHPSRTEKTRHGNTVYYPMLKQKGSSLKKLYNNWTSKIESEDEIEKYLTVINDFKPDLIQIFGTEGHFASLQNKISIPIVVHIQGIMNSCLNAWYPPGMNGFDDFFLGSKFMNILKANNKWFDNRRVKKQAIRERSYFLTLKNVMGRTEWVKGIAKLLMPTANYFDVGEMLRPVFYEGKLWHPKERSLVKIISVISSSTYKGMDQILKTAALLKNVSDADFEWNVCGVSAKDPLVKLMERKYRLIYNSNNINFLGTVLPEKIVELLLDSDVFVHPSYIETSCISIAEAQITGVPTIVCYVGGLTTTVENNVTGILVPTNDPYSMATKILYLKENKNIAAQIGLNAHNMAKNRHNKEKIFADLLNVYKKLICK